MQKVERDSVLRKINIGEVKLLNLLKDIKVH